MNNDLISRSELKKALKEYTQTQYNDDRPDLEYDYICIDDLNYVINNASTVDTPTYTDVIEANKEGYNTARRLYERPKGKWEKCQNDMFRCSNCRQADEVPITMGTPIYNFCPQCGADMRGEENETV